MAVYAGVGDRVAVFAEEYIVQTKGRWAGRPLQLQQWQRDFLDELYLVAEDGSRVYREALLGVPRKAGKSTLCAMLALYELLCSGEEGAEVYSAAAAKDQARVVFDQARSFIEASPRLQDWLRPMRNAIVCENNGGVYRVLSAEGSLAHGLNPSCVIIDELHAFQTPKQEELYYALTTGSLARENPMIVSITTAGFDRETVCWKVYEHGRDLERGGTSEMRSERFMFRWWQAPDGVPLDDEASWRSANPSDWIAISDLRRERRRLPENVFRRLHLNQWTEQDEAWLPEGAWDACRDEQATIPEQADVVLGVDVGTRRDTSAVVRLWVRPDGRVVPEAEVFAPRGDGTALELAVVEAAVRRNAARYNVRAVAYDPWSFERSAQEFEDEGLLMVQVPQTSERMSMMSANVFEAIVEQQFAHNGDPILASHVRAGATKPHERGWRLVKNKSSRPIDALMAMTIAFSQVDANASYDGPLLEMIG